MRCLREAGSGPVGDCPYLGAFLGQRLGEFDGVPCDDRQHRPEGGYVLELGDASVQILEGLLGQAVAAQLGLLVVAWLCRRSPALTYLDSSSSCRGRRRLAPPMRTGRLATATGLNQSLS
jgi:hypothetical protein